MQNFYILPTLALIGTTTYWVIMIGLAFLSYALRPKPSQTRPDPGQFEVPSISPGKSIPVVFGTVMIRDPAIVWWGDLRTEPIMSSGGGKK